eukprot:TRINITY_DN547_c0_g1_i1.p1 TRINITY_DN547_c0_g1~~TRINITY_DN547_c0_g1_i1.p1  ORF type:complete len:327 (+),score=51.91 TRINITY_DN547_c0_g1_i1:43-981(+)
MGAVFTYLRNWNEDSSWWHWTYFVDWVLAALPMLIWAPFRFYGPRCRDFDPTDPSINHPYSTHESFPNWSLPFIAWAAPMAVGVAMVWLFRLKQVPLAHDIHTVCLLMTQTFLLAIVITDPFKNFAGRHRPDFMSRLHREFNFTATNLPHNYMSTVCGSTESIITDGMRSFPSGHASMSFGGWTTMALLVSARLPMAKAKSVGFWRVIVLSLCLLPAVFVSISRTIDYRHHFGDIVCGGLIGVFSAIVVFRLHYAPDSRFPINRKTGIDAEAGIGVLPPLSPMLCSPEPTSPMPPKAMLEVNENEPDAGSCV